MYSFLITVMTLREALNEAFLFITRHKTSVLSQPEPADPVLTCRSLGKKVMWKLVDWTRKVKCMP